MKKRSLKEYVYVGDIGPTLLALALVGLWVLAMMQYGFSPLHLLSLVPSDRFFILGALGWTFIGTVPLMVGLLVWTVSERLKIARLAGTRYTR